MNNKALYILNENKRETYLFSQKLGGYSYPFAVADALISAQKKDRRPVEEILPTLPWTDINGVDIPIGIAFQRLTEDEYVGKLSTTIDCGDIPFTIRLDLDARTVSFTFNHNCTEFHHLPSVTIPLQGDPDEMCGSTMKELMGFTYENAETCPTAADEEDFYKKLITTHARSMARSNCEKVEVSNEK